MKFKQIYLKAKKQTPSLQASIDRLHHLIIESIQDKKGKEIVSIDLREVDDAVTDYFIICHGESTTQVKAIGEHIEQQTKILLNERVGHREGYDNMEWVLLDYFNIVVHVFLKDKRSYYNLEELWNDGNIQEFNEV